MSNRSLNKNAYVLDTNALINLTKMEGWQENFESLKENFQIFVPTPVLYEFQINRAKQDEQQQALSEQLNLDRGHEMRPIIFKLQQNRLPNGLYIVNPSDMEWLAATNRMAQHIENNELSSRGIQKHNMDHLIYSVARNLLGTICTDNEKDFSSIAQIGSQRSHDGTLEIIGLSDLIERLE